MSKLTLKAKGARLVLDLKRRTITGVNGRKMPLIGYSAEIGAGSLHKRQTITRWALVGPFAVIAPKKNQTATLTVTGPGIAKVFEIDGDQVTAAQQFAAQINLLS
jgi:hypothetical protein